MSLYTTELRYLCEVAAGLEISKGYDSVNDIIEKAIPVIFDFDFPIFDENYRKILEKKILKHYYTREIGFETAGLWKLNLDTKLNEIMPYYNKLYESELLKFEPLNEVNLTRIKKGESEGKKNETGNEVRNHEENKAGNTNYRVDTNDKNEINSSSSESNSGSTANKKLFSDTPQGGINGLENGNYLTEATIDSGSSSGNNSGSSQGESYDTKSQEGVNNVHESSNGKNSRDNVVDTSFNNTESYIESLVGKQSATSYSKLLNEFRSTFINIDMMIINDLEELFMMLW